MEIILDFDGTVVTHDFPRIGKDIFAVPVLKELVSKGHKLILFTMRSDKKNKIVDPVGNHNIINTQGQHLTEAVNWFKRNNIPLYGIQANPTQHNWTDSPKAYGQLIIDDAALGIPLINNPKESHRPFVDWIKVREMLIDLKIL